jgi:hypothetical protein
MVPSYKCDPLTVQNSTGNNANYLGGGIFNYYGTVYIEGSTISQNSARAGGGVANRLGKITFQTVSLTATKHFTAAASTTRNHLPTPHPAARSLAIRRRPAPPITRRQRFGISERARRHLRFRHEQQVGGRRLQGGGCDIGAVEYTGKTSKKNKE